MHHARMEMVYDRSIEDILTGKEVTGRWRWERSKETPNRGSYSTKPRRTGSTGVAEGAEGVIESRTRRRGDEERKDDRMNRIGTGTTVDRSIFTGERGYS